MLPAAVAGGNLFAAPHDGYDPVMAVVFGLIALAVVLAVVGLAYTAVKWLLIVAAVIFLLGVVRAFVSARGRSTPDGPGAR
jgi:membrane protein implicated in regulation of membrane protease activity